MRGRIAGALLLSLLPGVSATAGEDPTPRDIPVANPDFEDPPLNEGKFTRLDACKYPTENAIDRNPAIPAWTGFGCRQGIWNTPASVLPGEAVGGQRAYLGGNAGMIYQVLDATVEGDTVYTVTADVGMRADARQPAAFSYAVELIAAPAGEIDVGPWGQPRWAALHGGAGAPGDVLAEEFNDASSLQLTPGTLETRTLVAAIPRDHPKVGQRLVLCLRSLGRQQVLFDNVRLAARAAREPLPSACRRAEPRAIAVLNPGFEDSDGLPLDVGEFTTWCAPTMGNAKQRKPAVPHWKGNGCCQGVFNPRDSALSLGVSDGQVAYVQRMNPCTGEGARAQTIYQVLEDVVEADTVYTLEVDVGMRNDLDEGLRPLFSYAVQLLAAPDSEIELDGQGLPSWSELDGGAEAREHILAQDLDSLDVDPDSFRTSTVVAAIPRGHPKVGQRLIVRLRGYDSAVFFDNVRLEARRARVLQVDFETLPGKGPVVGPRSIADDFSSLGVRFDLVAPPGADPLPEGTRPAIVTAAVSCADGSGGFTGWALEGLRRAEACNQPTSSGRNTLVDGTRSGDARVDAEFSLRFSFPVAAVGLFLHDFGDGAPPGPPGTIAEGVPRTVRLLAFGSSQERAGDPLERCPGSLDRFTIREFTSSKDNQSFLDQPKNGNIAHLELHRPGIRSVQTRGTSTDRGVAIDDVTFIPQDCLTVQVGADGDATCDRLGLRLHERDGGLRVDLATVWVDARGRGRAELLAELLEELEAASPEGFAFSLEERGLLLCRQREMLPGGPSFGMDALWEEGEDDVTREVSPGEAETACGITVGACLSTDRCEWFSRGDADVDGRRNLTDAIVILNCLFRRTGPLARECWLCEDAADTNDDSSLNITDAIYLLGFLFLGGPPPPPPFDRCGLDSTGDGLGCTGSLESC